MSPVQWQSCGVVAGSGVPDAAEEAGDCLPGEESPVLWQGAQAGS